MLKLNRYLVASLPVLLATSLYCPPGAAMQAEMTPAQLDRLRSAFDVVVRCGETAVQTSAGAPPQDLQGAKTVLGENCMREFNDFIALADEANGRQASGEEANRQFEGAATALLQSRGESSGKALTVATVQQAAAPASCEGSVKKGLKAFNARNYELALCHWLPKAQAGDAAAQNNIGLLFQDGLSVRTPKSDEQAANWFHLAAQQGLSIAMRNLAALHARRGNDETSRAWIQLADATDLENRAIREQQQAQGIAVLAAGIACALGACPAASAPGASPMPTLGYGGSRLGRGSGVGSLDDYGRRSAAKAGTGSLDLGLDPMRMPGDRPSSPAMRMCADGSYVVGSCTMAPDGTYLPGRARMAPDGTYVTGTPRLAPDGTFVGGTGRMIMCPDGSFVTGERCVLAPNGKYLGR